MVAVAGIDYFISVKKSSLVSKQSPFVWSTRSWANTFADWSWIVPGTIIARDVRDTNPCIAISAIKPHRSPMSEAFS